MEPTAETKFIDRIREYIRDKKYISFDELKKYLEKYGEINEDTLKKTLLRLKNAGNIYDAGKGYYSTIDNTVELNGESIEKVKSHIKEKYPFLDFYLWGTEQIRYAFQHLITKPIVFVYSDKDALSSIKNTLSELGFNVYENPTTELELSKYVNISGETIILRPAISRVEMKDHQISIETILVDLYLESERLGIIDRAEYQRVFDYFLNSFRLDIGYLHKYADRRGVRDKIRKYFEMSIIAKSRP